MRVNIIGAGKVGTTFLRLLHTRPDVAIGDIFSRRAESAKAATVNAEAGRAVSTLDNMSPADLWLLTVPDDQIATTAMNLAHSRNGRDTRPSIAVHCSGFCASDELRPLRDLGWSIASCHPVLSFADPASTTRQFPGTYCGIEGDILAVERISKLMASLGGLPFSVQTEKKALYHAAAVFSNNFAVTLQGLALDAWAEAGVPDEVAQNLCRTLLHNTATSVGRVGPQAALTGPAARGDVGVLRRQEMALAEWNQDAADLYRLMSKMARHLKQTGKISGADRDACVERAL